MLRFRHLSPPFQKPACTVLVVPKLEHAFGPLGRCQHTIYAEYHLVVRTSVGDINLADTVKHGHHIGYSDHREPGWFGKRTGFSPHRCDSCRCAAVLSGSIICPCCRGVILVGDNVSLTDESRVRALHPHPDLLPYMTTWKSTGTAVVCADCAFRCFYSRNDDMLWNGSGVSTLHGHPKD